MSWEMGWQVYGTNHTKLSLPQVVWCYRGQYRIEDDWSRLKGQPLGLTPMYLQDEGRIQGLVHLLSLALRLLTLLEWVVRERLRKEETQLDEVYAGQPGRKTSRPSRGIALAGLADPVGEHGGGCRSCSCAVDAAERDSPAFT